MKLIKPNVQKYKYEDVYLTYDYVQQLQNLIAWTSAEIPDELLRNKNITILLKLSYTFIEPLTPFYPTPAINCCDFLDLCMLQTSEIVISIP